MGYTGEAIKGMSWTWALRFLMRAFSFVRVAVIARILTPQLFGLYGIAALVLAFVEVFTESGVNIIIIQEKEALTKKLISGAWIVSIARGFIIFLIIFLSAPFIANFFNAPESLYLLMLISITPLLRGFINPAIIKFQKNIDFKSEFLLRGTLFMLESISAIIFVFLLKDPAGIIYGLIVGAIAEILISFILIKPRPSLRTDKELVKKIIDNGKWITVGGIFNHLYHNADNAVVGKILGAGSLGIYDMAYRGSMLPITEVGETVSKVIFPVYSKISDDKDRLKRAFIRTMIGTIIFVIPIGLFFYIFAKPLIFFVFGPKWEAAVPIFQILAVFGVVRTVLNPILSLYLSVKKQKYNTLVSFTSFAAMMLAIVPFINAFGLIGAGYAVVLGALSCIPLAMYFLYLIFKN